MAQFTFSGIPGMGLAFFSFVFTLIWFVTLWILIARKDLDGINKLTWVIIVGLIPVAGVLLYYIFNWRRTADDLTHAIEVTRGRAEGTSSKPTSGDSPQSM